ncbi:MAG: twin-arginine translocation signal domain-containing protein [Candidatus Sericytochromatia bacterium]|uniref:Twin-arginine translocation signal domain-containing protein n=1 Tax=Candidatus Tanganyikabacteria bacterium TaxID=2961651 RepID=A0A938BMV8_9BACT|nr:twin-arginine translocation signal domain-containing protein [Candidatus Tanganyikabacteria bacterium]
MEVRTISRRSVLKGLAGTGAVLIAGSFPLVSCAGQGVPAPDFELKYFTPEEYRTVSRVAGVMLPGGDGAPPAADLEVSAHADKLIATLNPVLRDEFRQMLQLFENIPLLALKLTPFSRQTENGALEYLWIWRNSSVSVQRQGFNALKRLAAGIYYADPRSWSAIGYEGVWVGNRDLGYGSDNQGWAELVNPNVYKKFEA